MIEAIATLFVVGFVALAVYGHVLVARALLGHRDGEAKAARSREPQAETRSQAQLRKAG